MKGELDEEKLLVGVAAISYYCFGGRLSVHQIYRLLEAGGWPAWKLRGKWATRL
jgi:hypothetical protein